MLDLKQDQRLRLPSLPRTWREEPGALRYSTSHSQSSLPGHPNCREGAKSYFDFKERCVFCDIIRQELRGGARLVTETDYFVVLCPYAARFPFETWILPKRHDAHFEDSDAPTLENLAWVLRATLRKLDQALEHPAYNFIIHTAPLQEGKMPISFFIEIPPKLTKV